MRAMSVILASLVVLSSCTAKPAARRTAAVRPPTAATTQDRYHQAAEAFFDAYMEKNPTSAVELGLHRYDGLLPDVTAAGIQARLDWLKRQAAGIEAFPAPERA